MRFVATGFAFLASLIFIAACGAMNWFFWIKQGRDEFEGHVLGSISVAVDVFVCVIPIFVRLAAQHDRKVYAMLGRALFCVFFLFSFVSALGFAASNRSVVSGGHEAINNRLHEAELELEASERSRAQFGAHRFANVLQALIQKAESDNRYKASNKCGDPWPQIRAFCKEYGDLKIELANAQQDERLQARAGALKKEIADLRQRGGGQPDDAQAALVATLTGFSEHTAKNILSFGVAFLVELGAAFGLYLSTGWLPASHAETPARVRDQYEPDFKPEAPAMLTDESVSPPPKRRMSKAVIAQDPTVTEAPPKPRKGGRKKKEVQKSDGNPKPMRLQIGKDGVLRAKEE